MSGPTDPWNEVTAARLPMSGLATLASLRDVSDVRVTPAGEHVWVTWPASRANVVVRLRPVAGVRFFARRDSVWYEFGRRIPSSESPPTGGDSPLSAVLHPGRFDSTPPDAGGSPLAVTLVRGGPARPATAFRCSLDALSCWADTATAFELATVRAARFGTQVIALGTVTVPDSERFWGDGVFAPVGFRFEPDLPPALVRMAAAADTTDLVFVSLAGTDVIPSAAFRPLTRAGVRLSLAPARP